MLVRPRHLGRVLAERDVERRRAKAILCERRRAIAHEQLDDGERATACRNVKRRVVVIVRRRRISAPLEQQPRRAVNQHEFFFFNAAEHASLRKVAYVAVSDVRRCAVELRVEDATSSGEHKWKLVRLSIGFMSAADLQ